MKRKKEKEREKERERVRERERERARDGIREGAFIFYVAAYLHLMHRELHLEFQWYMVVRLKVIKSLKKI